MTRTPCSIFLAIALAVAAVPAQAGGCYLWVEFGFGSTALSSKARGLLDRTAALYPQSGYKIVAHADAPGSEFQNLVVSRERTDAVAGHLRARGVTGIASLDARAQTELRVATHGPEGQNRRAEIYVSPCSEAELGSF